MDLCFYDRQPAQLLGNLASFFFRERNLTARHLNTMLCEQSFRLILVNLHEHSICEGECKTGTASAFSNKAAPLYRIGFDCQGEDKSESQISPRQPCLLYANKPLHAVHEPGDAVED